MSLYDKNRPTTLDEIEGQETAIKLIRNFEKRKSVPHAIMLVGPTGVGKTTLAHILTDIVGCRVVDVADINCGSCDPMDTIRTISETVFSHFGEPLSGKSKAWILDEAQALSRSPFTQQGLLKILEKAPKWAYFFLCTTDPAKIIPTVRGRCETIKLSALNLKQLESVIERVCEVEKLELDKDVMTAIVCAADGSARQALVMLESVVGLSSKEAMTTIERAVGSMAGIDLARALVAKKQWKEVAAILKGLEGEESEKIRRQVLGYAKAVLLNGGLVRAAEIIDVFRDDCFAGGFPLLCRMAHQLSAK